MLSSICARPQEDGKRHAPHAGQSGLPSPLTSPPHARAHKRENVCAAFFTCVQLEGSVPSHRIFSPPLRPQAQSRPAKARCKFVPVGPFFRSCINRFCTPPINSVNVSADRLQVVEKFTPFSSIKIGLDLVPIKPIPGCKTFCQDITTPACYQLVRGLSLSLLELSGSQGRCWRISLFLHLCMRVLGFAFSRAWMSGILPVHEGPLPCASGARRDNLKLFSTPPPQKKNLTAAQEGTEVAEGRHRAERRRAERGRELEQGRVHAD